MRFVERQRSASTSCVQGISSVLIPVRSLSESRYLHSRQVVIAGSPDEIEPERGFGNLTDRSKRSGARWRSSGTATGTSRSAAVESRPRGVREGTWPELLEFFANTSFESERGTPTTSGQLQPALVMRFEARDQQTLVAIRSVFEHKLKELGAAV